MLKQILSKEEIKNRVKTLFWHNCQLQLLQLGLFFPDPLSSIFTCKKTKFAYFYAPKRTLIWESISVISALFQSIRVQFSYTSIFFCNSIKAQFFFFLSTKSPSKMITLCSLRSLRNCCKTQEYRKAFH